MSTTPTAAPTPTAAITGAGSGIGRATALMLSQLGYNLVLLGRTREALTETASLCGTPVEVVGGDVTDPTQVKHFISRAVERFGGLHALINNAGYAPLKPIDQSPPELIERAFRVNALGPAYAIHFAWPVMKAGGGGRIVSVSTLGTLDPFPGFFAYAAAKASVNLMTQSVAKEGARLNIKGFAVAPGAVETSMLRSIFPVTAIKPEQCLQPADVARVIVDCVTGARDGENGRTIVVKA
jgi:NAD(P)-dependent dehydrogenase (short-subunit alcohol dehydrogenase family)